MSEPAKSDSSTAVDPLEVLRTLHDAASFRWEKRRGYEWSLSYAIWTALAGLIAAMLFGKDSHLAIPALKWAVAMLVIPVALHFFYLFFMVRNTLHDLVVQSKIERDVLALLDVPPRHLVSADLQAMCGDTRWWKTRYGLIAQVGVTIFLCGIAAWVAATQRQKPPSSVPAVCSCCTR